MKCALRISLIFTKSDQKENNKTLYNGDERCWSVLKGETTKPLKPKTKPNALIQTCTLLQRLERDETYRQYNKLTCKLIYKGALAEEVKHPLPTSASSALNHDGSEKKNHVFLAKVSRMCTILNAHAQIHTCSFFIGRERSKCAVLASTISRAWISCNCCNWGAQKKEKPPLNPCCAGMEHTKDPAYIYWREIKLS